MADTFSFSEKKYLLVGKVAKPQGLKGEIKVQAYSDEPESLLGYEVLFLIDSQSRISPPLKVLNGRFQGRNLILKIETINDRNDAEEIHGMGILVLKQELQDVEENEYYWYQFYNLPVETEQGEYIGAVHSIFSNGAQDILVVKDGKKEILIPILDSTIKEHNKDGVVITPLPGLLELNSGNNE